MASHEATFTTLFAEAGWMLAGCAVVGIFIFAHGMSMITCTNVRTTWRISRHVLGLCKWSPYSSRGPIRVRMKGGA